MPFDWDKNIKNISKSTLSKEELSEKNQGALDFFKDLNINIKQTTIEE